MNKKKQNSAIKCTFGPQKNLAPPNNQLKSISSMHKKPKEAEENTVFLLGFQLLMMLNKQKVFKVLRNNNQMFLLHYQTSRNLDIKSSVIMMVEREKKETKSM